MEERTSYVVKAQASRTEPTVSGRKDARYCAQGTSHIRTVEPFANPTD